VSLMTAHKILIGSAIALFVLYGALEARGALAGEPGAGWRAAASAAAAAGFAFYFRSLLRAPK
jgi:hypothetical protein